MSFYPPLTLKDNPAVIGTDSSLLQQDFPFHRPPLHSILATDSSQISTPYCTSPTLPQHRKKSVRFSVVVVYSFAREQGFCTIPDTGWCSLGMAWQHFDASSYDIHHHQLITRLERRRRYASQTNGTLNLKRKSSVLRRSACTVVCSNSSVFDLLHWSPSSPLRTSPLPSPPSLSPHTSSSRTSANAFDYAKHSTHPTFTPPPPCLTPPSPCRILAYIDESFGNFIFNLSATSCGSSLHQSSSTTKVAQHKKLSPIQASARLRLLRDSGVIRLDESERSVCLKIRASRAHVGCTCGPDLPCISEKCSCVEDGIQCQVDRACFPCSCSPGSCYNPHGRAEFSQDEARAYVLSVLQRSQVKLCCTSGALLNHSTFPGEDTEASGI